MAQVEPSSVVIIDDDEDVAALLEVLVTNHPAFRVVLASGDPAAGLRFAADLGPDVAVVGAHRGTFDHSELVASLRASTPATRIVLLIDLADPITLLDALGRGADTVLSSGAAWSELVPTLQLLLRGSEAAVA